MLVRNNHGLFVPGSASGSGSLSGSQQSGSKKAAGGTERAAASVSPSSTLSSLTSASGSTAPAKAGGRQRSKKSRTQQAPPHLPFPPPPPGFGGRMMYGPGPDEGIGMEEDAEVEMYAAPHMMHHAHRRHAGMPPHVRPPSAGPEVAEEVRFVSGFVVAIECMLDGVVRVVGLALLDSRFVRLTP